MPNVINGTSTGSGGLITSGDDSGILNIQTNETTAMSIDASQSVDFTNNIDAPNTFGFKNRIINGNMAIDQRNAGASVNTVAGTNTYTLDRWYYYAEQASKFTVQQTPSATEAGYQTRVTAGFTNYLGITSSSAFSSAATDRFVIAQKIEGLNASDLAWGTSGAATVTLSFLVRSSLTGSFSGSLLDSAASQSYPFSFTISTANTWEQKSVTIAGPTTGTWTANNTGMIRVQFNLGSGSNFLGTAGAWTGSLKDGVTGSVSVVGTNGATFYITGVQLEKGTQATSFDFRDYGRELILCQRYYWATTGQQGIWNGNTTNTNAYFMNQMHIVTMRTTPTIVDTSSAGVGFGAVTWIPLSNQASQAYAFANNTGSSQYFYFGANFSAEL